MQSLALNCRTRLEAAERKCVCRDALNFANTVAARVVTAIECLPLFLGCRLLRGGEPWFLANLKLQHQLFLGVEVQCRQTQLGHLHTLLRYLTRIAPSGAVLSYRGSFNCMRQSDAPSRNSSVTDNLGGNVDSPLRSSHIEGPAGQENKISA